jgi:adenylate kinase
MDRIKLHDKEFEIFLTDDELDMDIEVVAERLNADYADKTPIFIAVLNGAFMFASELFKQVHVPCEISFVKLASYVGTSTTGEMNQLIGLSGSVEGRHLIIIEDIVDTGHTLEHLMNQLSEQKPASIEVATLLMKPDAYIKHFPVKYVARRIPNEFVVGFGLDYDGLGRNLPHIYTLATENEMTDKLNIVLFGPPGAGKGTQSENLIENYGLKHLSTGDLLRGEIAEGTELGSKAKVLMDAGELVPDEIVIGMIENQLELNSAAHGFIFDGFPRTKAQAEALDNLLSKHGMSITSMLALEVDEDELVKRLLERGKVSGRSDDQDESVIRNRISTYEEKTAPLKAYYSGQGKFKAIEGIGSIEQISHRLYKAIDG